jgi:serine/threonine-protein kinase
MKLSIFSAWAAISLASLSTINCSKSGTDNNIGQFPAQLSQFPEGVTPTNIEQEVVGSDAVLPQGILARKSAWLRHHTQINTNVFVLGNCTGQGCLDPATAPANPKHVNNVDSELTVGVYVSVPTGRILKADKIRLKNRANVQGTTEANTYAQATSAVIANKLSPLTTLPRLPFFLKGTPGQANINVTGQELTLASGQYANVTVRQAKKLVLQGGFYQVHDIDLKRESSLECQSQCYLTVKADIIADKKVTVKAASGNPNDFLIYVEGGDAAAQPMAASAKSVQLAGLAHITANIYAPNGRLMFGAGTIAQGAFIGNHVRIEPNSIVTQGPQPTGIARFIEASVGGTVEIPGKVKLEVPANALAEDTVISVQEKGPIPSTAPRSPAQLRFVSEAFEFQPDGLTFLQNYTLTMNYDPVQVAAIGVTPNDICIFSAPSESVLYAPSASAKVVGTNQLQAEENHFTIFVIGSGGVGDSVSGLKLIGDRLIVSDLRGGDGPRYRISRYNIANKATVPQFENYSRWTALGNILANDQHVFTLERGYLPSGSPLASPVRLDTGMVNANCSSAPLSLHNQFYDFERGWIYEHLGITRLALWGTIVSGISQIQGSSPNNCNLNLTSPNDAFMPDYRAHDIMVSGNTFYSASGIYPFSVQVRANSFSGGVLGGFSGGFVYAMRPKGNFAIFGTQAIGVPGVVAFDPGTQGIYRHSTGRSFETIYDLVVTGNVVYALGVSGSGQITEMDMTDPTTPQPPMSSIAVAPDTFHMAQSGNYLVVAEGAFSSPNLRLINIGFPVRGTVTGLVSGTLELVNTVTTGTPPKTVISANGAYQNAELIADGNAYNFVVATQPPGYNCTVSNGSGVMDFHNAPNSLDVSCAPMPPLVVTVTTLAGTGDPGAIDGPGVSASFNSPTDITVDSSGNIYVADFANHRIRKVTYSGIVTTFVGSTEGFADGIGSAAKFRFPRNITTDSIGNVYVSDSGNHRVRKITPGGLVSTLAGSTQGYADGFGAAAKFSGPVGLTVDGSGNILVADSGNYKIRKITPDGSVTTFAGSTSGSADGPVNTAQFRNAFDVAVDSAGNIYVADVNAGIRRISGGMVTTVVSYFGATSLVLDNFGNAYFTDYLNKKLSKVDGMGVVTTFAGTGTSGNLDGSASTATFNLPYGLTMDSAGVIFVVDVQNNNIRKIQ